MQNSFSRMMNDMETRGQAADREIRELLAKQAKDLAQLREDWKKDRELADEQRNAALNKIQGELRGEFRGDLDNLRGELRASEQQWSQDFARMREDLQEQRTASQRVEAKVDGVDVKVGEVSAKQKEGFESVQQSIESLKSVFQAAATNPPPLPHFQPLRRSKFAPSGSDDPVSTSHFLQFKTTN